MRAVVDAAIFVAMSGDDVVDPDAAVAYLEQLSATLKDLAPEDRRHLVEVITNMESADRRAGLTDRADFLSALADNLGLLG